MNELIETQRWTRTDDNGQTQTAMIDTVVGPYGKPVVLVDPSFVGELLGLGGYTRADG